VQPVKFLKNHFSPKNPKYYEKENIKIPQTAENQNRVPFIISTKPSPGYGRYRLLEQSPNLCLLRANLYNKFVLI
jgi:hypothetical protein